MSIENRFKSNVKEELPYHNGVFSYSKSMGLKVYQSFDPYDGITVSMSTTDNEISEDGDLVSNWVYTDGHFVGIGSTLKMAIDDYEHNI